MDRFYICLDLFRSRVCRMYILRSEIFPSSRTRLYHIYLCTRLFHSLIPRDGVDVFALSTVDFANVIRRACRIDVFGSKLSFVKLKCSLVRSKSIV